MSGGAVGLVINNQVGFTTSNPLNTVLRRTVLYRQDRSAPIFHVNADNAEAVLVTRLALDFRNTFKRDVFIDLAYYRHHGHDQADSRAQPSR
ncbi:thiamine pyrophosphate-dependent enzyme [Escherichia coli]